MTYYGVRRLIAINSGGFLYADVDLSMPVHLVARNNRGKSTLVNALQFLYIDEIAKMSFGGRSVDDTYRHYFGQDLSYLIFECGTPSNIQCLIVRGLGPLRNYRFERYVYQGEYNPADYQDENRHVVTFDVLRTRFANRGLLEVPVRQLWEVLSGQLTADDANRPRLSILPLKKQDEYRAFRDVFASLLRLSNMNSRDLQNLIIQCHAREITEMRIDVANEYKAEFERAERAEHEAGFIRSAREEIQDGARIRQEIAATIAKITVDAPRNILEAQSYQYCLHARRAQFAESIADRMALRSERDKEQRALGPEVGKLGERLSNINETIDALEKEHAKWSTYTTWMIQVLRDNIETAEVQISQLRQHLLSGLDVATLKSEVKRLADQLTMQSQALLSWDAPTMLSKVVKAIWSALTLLFASVTERPAELFPKVVDGDAAIKAAYLWVSCAEQSPGWPTRPEGYAR
jgi:hypothetical protein